MVTSVGTPASTGTKLISIQYEEQEGGYGDPDQFA